jgi:hypothetical protein
MNVLTTDEAEKHLQLQSGSGGTGLADMIELVSVKLARFAGRDAWGPVESRTEYHDGGSSFLFPRVWPVESFRVYEDTDHEWAPDTELSADDFYATESGTIVSESGKFGDGVRNIKLVYTGGYASTESIPAIVKMAAKIQLEREYNARKRPGRQGDAASSMESDAEIVPEAARLISPMVRRLPFI